MTEKIIYFLKKCSETMNKDEIIDEILNYISENDDKDKVEEYKNCIKKSLNHYKINQNNGDDNGHSTLLTKEIFDSFSNGNIYRKILNSKYYILYIYTYKYCILFNLIILTNINIIFYYKLFIIIF